MSNKRVLVIDEHRERQQELVSMLKFLGYHGVVATTLAKWKQSTQPGDVAGVFVGGIGAELLPSLCSEIFAWDGRLPVFAYSETLEPTPSGVLAQFVYPPTIHQLHTYLHRIQVFSMGSSGGAGRSALLQQMLVGESRAIQQVRRLIEQVADSEANVLVLGESGTGKEVVASSLHLLSSRNEHPFVPVNCGAIPAELLESELFGHEKGAFTGALTARQGRFEIAGGGSLFLDEIGDMPMPMQVKLLRVLQERTFERVGSNKSLHADVRVIAATHRNLEEHISQGDFREDLFFRLNVFPIEIPSLKERVEDIPILINELVARLERDGRDGVSFTPAALNSLQHYPWPGNVRELANLVERLTIMFPNAIVDFDDLPFKFQSAAVDLSGEPPMPEMIEVIEPVEPVESQTRLEADTTLSATLSSEGMDLKEYLAELERDYIQQALDRADGVVAQAAKLLNFRRTTLVEKMRKYGLQRGE